MLSMSSWSIVRYKLKTYTFSYWNCKDHCTAECMWVFVWNSVAAVVEGKLCKCAHLNIYIKHAFSRTLIFICKMTEKFQGFHWYASLHHSNLNNMFLYMVLQSHICQTPGHNFIELLKYNKELSTNTFCKLNSSTDQNTI